MKDFEEDKPQYCNYFGNVEGRPMYIPVAATGVCSGSPISIVNPLFVRMVLTRLTKLNMLGFWFQVSIIAEEDDQIAGATFCQTQAGVAATKMSGTIDNTYTDEEMTIPIEEQFTLLQPTSGRRKRQASYPTNGFV